MLGRGAGCAGRLSWPGLDAVRTDGDQAAGREWVWRVDQLLVEPGAVGGPEVGCGGLPVDDGDASVTGADGLVVEVDAAARVTADDGVVDARPLRPGDDLQ